MNAFNIICGLVTIAAFVFSLWIWMRADMRVRELTHLIDAINRIAAAAITDSQMVASADVDLVAKRAEKAIASLFSIRTLTEKYTPAKNVDDGGHLALVEQGFLWTKRMIWQIESSQETAEIWLFTPDLKPDSSEASTGKSVLRNLKCGKRYVYFYPANMPHVGGEISKLRKNIGLEEPENALLKSFVAFVPVEQGLRSHFGNCNTIFYFRDAGRLLEPRCFEEITFTKYPTRGAYWQEHADNKAVDLKHLLGDELQKALSKAP